MVKNPPAFRSDENALKLIVVMVLQLSNILKTIVYTLKKKESACQCRGHGFEPWSGKIPHAAE